MLGDCTPDLDRLQTKFGHLGAPQGSGMLAFEKPREVRHVEEVQPLSQSKLSMAYRIDCTPEDAMLFRLMAAVLGGVPSSKLFQNVREKMSLCYYCSAGLSLNSRTLFVESGVETENLEKAEREIGKQLEALQNGDLTEEELLSAKLALRNSLHAVEDSLPSWRAGAWEEPSAGKIFPYKLRKSSCCHTRRSKLHRLRKKCTQLWYIV